MHFKTYCERMIIYTRFFILFSFERNHLAHCSCGSLRSIQTTRGTDAIDILPKHNLHLILELIIQRAFFVVKLTLVRDFSAIHDNKNKKTIKNWYFLTAI